ncbi:MAG: 2-hydroxyacid dehydrogenase [Gammaproteobacteria bacterium]|nr:2-hydroxyacid dehydrogenase [Gammaproteobacteria bacterium]MCP5137489.1 2-hydroxyacid dehydrogenase [Gammaproteobacteria bacterium]
MTAPLNGVMLDRASFDTGDLDLAALHAVANWTTHEATAPAEIAARIADADVVITNKVVLDAATIDAAPRLRLICVAATGYNNIDLAAAARRGIVVSNVRAYATPAVVQHVFALILALTTRLRDYAELAIDGRWSASSHFCRLDFPIHEIAGRTLGIVGHGELGRGVAEVARAFDMKVLIAARPGDNTVPEGRVALPDLLAQVDVLSLHTPLTARTRNLIGHDELARMRPDAMLINTARGAIVDGQALADALRNGVIGGAGIDVVDPEPPASGHPLLAPDIPNLILTPHVAWASREARQRLVEEMAANIQAFVSGTPRNTVNA